MWGYEGRDFWGETSVGDRPNGLKGMGMSVYNILQTGESDVWCKWGGSALQWGLGEEWVNLLSNFNAITFFEHRLLKSQPW